MSFAIEVPGEANPLNWENLCRALHGGTSNNYAFRQSAGQQLAAWETQPDFYSTLQSIYLERSLLPQDLRFLAIIQFKNGIDKYWRSVGSRQRLSVQERQAIRSRLLEGCLNEDKPSLALQNALAMAKIVRIDYPNTWPTAIDEILASINTFSQGSHPQLGGALLVLHRVVKELGTARLRRSQVALQETATRILRVAGDIYMIKTRIWIDFLTQGSGSEDEASLAMQNSLLVLKVIRHLLVFGYEYPHEESAVQEFWVFSQTQFGQLFAFVNQNSLIPVQKQDMIGKHLIKLAKVHIGMATSQGTSFAVFPSSVPLVHAYWNLVANFADGFEKSGGIQRTGGGGGDKSKFEGPLLEKLALQGLLLLTQCIDVIFRPLQTFRYRSLEVKAEQERAIRAFRSTLFADDFVLQIVNVMVTKLLMFRQSDLEAWEADPEEWEAAECSSGSAWEWGVRPCAERICSKLLVHFQAIVREPLLVYFRNAALADAGVVAKEAIYTVMGCAAGAMCEAVDFDSILESTLVRDVQIQDPMAKLIRRRIAILLSQWISVRISPEKRPIVYEIFRHLLNSQDPLNDEVVRLTTARCVHDIANDFGFESQAFLPFAPNILAELVKLLREELQVDETRLAVLASVRVIVSRMGGDIAPLADDLMASLSSLWSIEKEGEFILKQAILATTTALIASMSAQSQRYHPLVLPLVQSASDPDSPLHLNLIEDTVELWKAVLENSPPPLPPDLSDLIGRVYPLVEYDSDVSRQCLDIMTKYIILAPASVLADSVRRPILASLFCALKAQSSSLSHAGARCIELTIRAAADLGGSQGASVIVQDLLELGLLPGILQGLRSSWEAHQVTGPKRPRSPLRGTTKTLYLQILARIGIADPVLLVMALAEFGSTAQPDNNPPNDPTNNLNSTWTWLGPTWFANFDTMSSDVNIKSSCLALTRLSELPPPVHKVLILEHLQDYFTMWTSAVHRLSNVSGQDHLVVDHSAAAADISEWATPFAAEERKTDMRDPVYMTHTCELVLAHLQSLVQVAGGEQQFEQEWAVNVDRDVLMAFQQLREGRIVGQPQAG